MDAKVRLTAFAREGEGKASFECLAKSIEDVSVFEIGIEAKEKRSSIRFAINSDGKAELQLDPDAVRIFAQSVAMEVARTVIESSILNLSAGDARIKGDNVLNLLSDTLINMGAPNLNIGSGALKLSAREQALFNFMTLILKCTSSLTINSPMTEIKGSVRLGTGQLRNIARIGDQVQVVGVKPGEGTVTGTIVTGGSNMSS